VENGPITCPCHGCRFSAVDGSVPTRAATKPLAEPPDGRAADVHPLLYAVAVLFVLYFLRGPLEALIP